MNKTESYYGKEYFSSYQKKIGEFEGKANLLYGRLNLFWTQSKVIGYK